MIPCALSELDFEIFIFQKFFGNLSLLTMWGHYGPLRQIADELKIGSSRKPELEGLLV